MPSETTDGSSLLEVADRTRHEIWRTESALLLCGPDLGPGQSSDPDDNLLEVAFELEFFVDDVGRAPCREWMRALDDDKLAPLIGALRAILAEQGIAVCGTPFGKHLGQGLAEFRVRRETDRSHVLLRIFFHAYGDHRILLLSGYDKGADPSERRQHKEIRVARRLLQGFRER